VSHRSDLQNAKDHSQSTSTDAGITIIVKPLPWNAPTSIRRNREQTSMRRNPKTRVWRWIGGDWYLRMNKTGDDRYPSGKVGRMGFRKIWARKDRRIGP
jgi:hypothetical protein